MGRKKILTQVNVRILREKLREYLLEVLKEEEYFKTLKDCYDEVIRIKNVNEPVTIHTCSEWLRGLPIGTEYTTYNICCMLFAWLGKNERELDNLEAGYEESMTDLDNFYWNMLGEIIWRAGI